MLTCLSRRSIAGALLLVSLPACTYWRAEPMPPAQFLQEHHPTSVRVLRLDSSQVELGRPRLSGDSVVGSTHRGIVSVPLGDIVSLSTSRLHALKSVAAGAAFVAAIVGIWALNYDPYGNGGL